MGDTRQLEIDFEPGLTVKWPRWWECVQASVLAVGNQKAIAADLDMSKSEFSRRMKSDPADIVFHASRIDDLMDLLAAKGETRPVMWMIERYLGDGDITRKRRARQLLSQFETLLPALVAIAEEEADKAGASGLRAVSS